MIACFIFSFSFQTSMETKLETKVNQQVVQTDTSTKDIKAEATTSFDTSVQKEEKEVKYFQCSSCIFKQEYDYFGSNPPQVKNYILLEDGYVIEDPFFPPKRGKIVILGAHCIKCRKSVCKDVNCSVYFDGTFCIQCAKNNLKCFPLTIQEKLNRII